MKQKYRTVVFLFIGLLVLSLSSISGAPGATVAFQEGEKLSREGDYREALSYYKKAIQENPGFTAAMMGAALASMKIGDYGQASHYYNQVLAVDPDRTDAKIGAGLTALYRGDLIRAGEILRAVADRDPGNEDNNHALALYHIASGRPDLASLYLRKVIRSRPSHIPSLLTLTEIYYRSGNVREATQYLERAEKISPGDPELHRVRGEMAMYRALHSLSKQERNEAFDKARQSILISLSIKKDQPEVEKKLILLDYRQGHLQEALLRSREWMDKNGFDPGLAYIQSEILMESETEKPPVSEAVAILDRVTGASPYDSISRFKMESLVLSDGIRFTSGGDIRSRLGDYHYKKSIYYDSTGKLDQADFYLSRSLLLLPENPEAHKLKLEYYRINGDYEQFLNELEWLSRNGGKNPSIQFRMESAIKARSSRLPFRENLISPEADPNHATFQRTPAYVYVFDFEADEPFPYHPDGGRLLARAIEYALDFPGSVRPLPEKERESLTARIHVRKGEELLQNKSTLYSANLLPVFAEEKGLPVAAVVTGNYSSGPEGISLRIRIIDSNSGNDIVAYKNSASGKDAIFELGRMVAWKIRGSIPLSGLIVKVKSGSIFINLGKVDGIKANETLEVISRNGQKSLLKIVETGSYASRGVIEGGNWLHINEGDVVRIPSETGGPVPEKKPSEKRGFFPF